MDDDVRGTEGGEGLRSRKGRRTRERIAQAAMVLFLEKGFEQTPVSAIAEAADVSRRTFFHYFGSKEAILDVVEDKVQDAFRTTLAATPGGARPLAAVRAALLQMVERYESEEAIAFDRLMRSTEALRARKQANYERQERVLFEALLERWSGADQQSALRMIAMASIGAMRVATERWRDAPERRSLASELNQAFQELADLGV